jgi:hypothetical protein
MLFEECHYLELNADLYLRYYFSSPKELLQAIGKKIAMIKEESNELYLICKVKENLTLSHNLADLESYQNTWEKSFARKHKLIERVRKQHKQKLKW